MLTKEQNTKLNELYQKHHDLFLEYQGALKVIDMREMLRTSLEINKVKEQIDEIKANIKVEWREHQDFCDCEDCMNKVEAWLGN